MVGRLLLSPTLAQHGTGRDEEGKLLGDRLCVHLALDGE